MLMIMSMLVSVLLILLSVGLYTWFERKLLSLSQNRIGPNKISIKGFIQFMLDGLKLMTKSLMFPFKGFILLWIIVSILIFSVSLMFWWSVEMVFNSFSSSHSMFLLLILLGLSCYFLLFIGWFSSSKYGLVGGLRSTAMSISYEIGISLLVVSFLVNSSSLNVLSFVNIFLFPLFFLWFLASLIESNRSPFDMSEGESELISGVNIELPSSSFVLLFLSEYSMILFLCLLSVFLIKSSGLLLMFLVILFISARATFPRMKYSSLMEFMWKDFVMISITILLFTLLL